MERARLIDRIRTGVPKAEIENPAPRALRASRTSPTVANINGMSRIVNDIARVTLSTGKPKRLSGESVDSTDSIISSTVDVNVSKNAMRIAENMDKNMVSA